MLIVDSDPSCDILKLADVANSISPVMHLEILICQAFSHACFRSSFNGVITNLARSFVYPCSSSSHTCYSRLHRVGSSTSCFDRLRLRLLFQPSCDISKTFKSHEQVSALI